MKEIVYDMNVFLKKKCKFNIGIYRKLMNRYFFNPCTCPINHVLCEYGLGFGPNLTFGLPQPKTVQKKESVLLPNIQLGKIQTSMSKTQKTWT